MPWLCGPVYVPIHTSLAPAACVRPPDDITTEASTSISVARVTSLPTLLPLREIANVDVLELHVAPAAGVELQRDGAVERLRVRVGEVHHLHAVETRDVAVALHLEQVLVPLAQPHDRLVLGRGPDNPLPAVPVDAAGVLVDRAVHFELQAL